MARLRSSLASIARRSTALMLALALVGVLAGGLAACGKRGDPEPPPGEKDEFPKRYPDPKSYPKNY